MRNNISIITLMITYSFGFMHGMHSENTKALWYSLLIMGIVDFFIIRLFVYLYKIYKLKI